MCPFFSTTPLRKSSLWQVTTEEARAGHMGVAFSRGLPKRPPARENAAGAQQGQGTRGPFARRGSNRLPRSHTASLRNVLENAFQQGFIGGISGRLTFKKREAKAKAMVQVPKSEKYENKRVNAALRKAQEKRDADAVEQVELDKAVQKGKERRAPRS